MSSCQPAPARERVLVITSLCLALALTWALAAGPRTVQAGAEDDSPGIPNAGAQRQKMIDELRLLRQSVDAMNKTLSSTKFKVEVTNLDKLRPAPATDGPVSAPPASK
jgi:hypothetical protein